MAVSYMTLLTFMPIHSSKQSVSELDQLAWKGKWQQHSKPHISRILFSLTYADKVL